MTRRRSIYGRGGNPRSIANLKRGGNPAPATKVNRLTHGGYRQVAEAELDAKARNVFEALAADAPLRSADGGLPAHDAVVVRLLADVLCRLDSVGAWLAGRWATEQARPVIELEVRLRGQALDLCESLGMTPRSRARLGIDIAKTEATMAEALADGRAAWERRMGGER